jgi:DNA-binding transcriptional LysR family regulator
VDIDSIDIRLLSIFDAVVLEKNISKAAQRLGLSQSAVSQAVGRLRQLLGDDLFERSRYGVRLTPRAVDLAEPVRTALATLRAALDPTDGFDPEGSDRTFTIGMREDITPLIAPALLARLPAGSAVRFQLVSRYARRHAVDLRFGSPEIAIDNEPLEEEGCRSQLLYEDELRVVARKGHPKISKRLDRETFLAQQHVILTRSAPDDQSLIARHLARLGLARRTPVSTPSSGLSVIAVASSDLIATVPRRLAEAYAAVLAVDVHPFPFEQAKLPVYLIWHERFELDAGHRWLREQIRALLLAT